MFHKVIETSPGRFAYELTDGSGVGSGYRSQEAADAAAKRALGINPGPARPMTEADRNAFAGMEWLGV